MIEDINLNMVDNGLDFVLKSLDTIDKSDEDLKYSLLNLHAGIQLILKEILYQKDWSLIFQKEEDADIDKLRTGDFSSVNYKTLIKRLKHECDLELDKKLSDKLNWLKKERNIAEHYQFVVSSDVLKSNIVQLLTYLIPFLKTEMVEMGYISSDDDRFIQIKEYLHTFDAYVDERLKLIEDEVDAIHVPMKCPVCFQETVDFIDETDAFCHFCDEQIEGFTDEYFYYFVDRYSYIKDGGDNPVMECPSCEYETFIFLDGNQYVCLSCGVKPTQEELTTCPGPVCAEKIVYRLQSSEGEYEPSFCEMCLDYFRDA
ncbi:hypothetical protein M3685_13235 [Heyndrickxia oleronia]|uniref:hypothetical protein n=1 Tax=Heyndrickxia oleronia TaxID=38875 RepID=UPI00203F31AB|nr:hypothetical protein [Heyndrickxia oleronia]MCM3454885.1 hypothetical protein [Heyndrickxia oleronia]